MMTRSAAEQPGSPQFEAESDELNEYLFGRMTEAEASKFEDRLMRDPAFYARMQPMLDFWYLGDMSSAEAAQETLKILATEPREEAAEERRARWWGHVHHLVPWTAVAAAILVGVVAVRERPPAPEQPRTVATNDSTNQDPARSVPGVDVGAPGSGIAVTGAPPGTTVVDPPNPRKGRGSFIDGVKDGLKDGRAAKANGARSLIQRAFDWIRAHFSRAPAARTVPTKPTPGPHK